MATKKKEPTKDAKAAAPKATGKPVEAKAPAASAKAAIKAPPASAAPKADLTAADTATAAHGFRRKLVGKVTSNKMDKTVTVEVIRNSPDPVYKKYVRARERYKAHDETNQYKIGDRVEIQEHRPISRDKRWLVTKLISRAVEE